VKKQSHDSTGVFRQILTIADTARMFLFQELERITKNNVDRKL
jgi:hypothetical protein